ncbi:MAG: FlgO family outer membrane protein [Elusimicrobiota bacterium]
MKRTLVLLMVCVVFPVCLFGATDPYEKMAIELSGSNTLLNNPKVAVIPFKNIDDQNQSKGIIISENLLTRIVKIRKLQVVERENLEAVLRELKIESSGIIDPETTKQIGKILGVDALIIGTIHRKDENTLTINARVVRTETGEVLVTSNVDIMEKTKRKMPYSADDEEVYYLDDSTSKLLLRVVVDAPGILTEQYRNSGIEWDFDTKMGFSLGGEYLFPHSNKIGLGIGFEYQFHRDMTSGNWFNFAPIYGLFKYHVFPNPRMYFKINLGYSIIYSGSESYSFSHYLGDYDLGGGIYYALGLGYVINDSSCFDIMYSVNLGEEISKNNSPNIDDSYKRISIAFGYALDI